MVQASTSPSMRRQCEILWVSRSSVYYEPVGADAEELALMRRIAELHLERPFYGSQSIARELKSSGDHAGAEREGELLRKIGELTVERDFLSNGLGRLR